MSVSKDAGPHRALPRDILAKTGDLQPGTPKPPKGLCSQAFSNHAFVSGVSERDWSLNTPRVRARATMTPGVGTQSQTEQDGAAPDEQGVERKSVLTNRRTCMTPHPKTRIRSIAGLARIGALLPLDQAFRLYGGSDKWLHRYSGPYRRHLGSKRLHQNRILEIGVGGYEDREMGGGSLRVWRDCFPLSRIVGLDLHEKNVDLGARVTVVQGDQASANDLNHVVEVLGGPPNIVIDDGSHLVDHAIASFSILFPPMPSGSIYVVEYLQTSYSQNWGGGIPAPETTAIGLARDLVDAIQVQDPTFDRRPQDGPKPSHWAADVGAVRIYPGIFFIEKA
jgi:hypothetical protein